MYANVKKININLTYTFFLAMYIIYVVNSDVKSYCSIHKPSWHASIYALHTPPPLLRLMACKSHVNGYTVINLLNITDNKKESAMLTVQLLGIVTNRFSNLNKNDTRKTGCHGNGKLVWHYIMQEPIR